MRPPSMRTTISCSATRKILLRVAAVAAGCDQASSRSAPSCNKCRRSFSPNGAGFLASKCCDLAFDPMHHLQRLVPRALQLASDQTIGGIDSIILPTGMRRREARLLQCQLELPLGG